MKQIISGWNIALVDKYKCKYFLGRYKTSEGVWYAKMYDNICEHNVFRCMFDSAEKALDFWNTCYLDEFVHKDNFLATPIYIEISIDMSKTEFDRNEIS